MKELRHNLFNQLISIGIIVFGIILISLGLILPKVLMPIYENNVYNYLRDPVNYIDTRIDNDRAQKRIAYIYKNDNTLITSGNYSNIISVNPNDVLEIIDQDYGKFEYNNNDYYYYVFSGNGDLRIAVTDCQYINQIQRDVVFVIFPVLFITLIIVLALTITWSRRLVVKIYHLQDKVANIGRDNYFDLYQDDYHLDDELNALSKTIDDMHTTLKMQEEYKNQMYQNISHDFKTPLTVIKSHIEAIEDGVLSKNKGIKIIEEQIDKLETKVQSLLYLNKLNYLKEGDNYTEENIDLIKIIESTIEKFKYQKKELTWQLKVKNKGTFKGTFDIWEAIIENMLNNFIRYAATTVKVEISKNQLTFFNDGPNIDQTLLDDIFTPYK